MTVAQMLDSLTLDEYLDWQAYERFEPFEPQRADLRAAMTASLMVNLQIPKGKPRTKAKDFMPDFDAKYIDKPAPDPRDLQNRLIACFGGTVNGR